MNKTVAIIDLGSNTFHLLICQISRGSFHEKFRKRIFVGLAEGGIEKIKTSALVRARKAFEEYQDILTKHDIQDLKILGTAALRSATNASEVNNMVQSIFGKPIEIINGEREAELIYKGVSQIIDTKKGVHLIMDIGGGSTEFIIVENGKSVWAHSFNIGVAVLHEMFHKSDPISKTEINKLNQFLNTTLSPLKLELEYYTVQKLIGASGSFEIIVAMNGKKMSSSNVHSFDLDAFSVLEHEVVSSDYDTRANLKGMPKSRVKLIVVAFLLMKHIINLINPRQIVVSPYALKEGVIVEMM